MWHTGRSAGVHAGDERLVQAQVVDAPLENPDLLPEVMLLHPHRASVGAGRELQHARVIARLRVVAQDLLCQTCHPSYGLIRKGHRIEKLDLMLRHASLPSSIRLSAQLLAMRLTSIW